MQFWSFKLKEKKNWKWKWKHQTENHPHILLCIWRFSYDCSKASRLLYEITLTLSWKYEGKKVLTYVSPKWFFLVFFGFNVISACSVRRHSPCFRHNKKWLFYVQWQEKGDDNVCHVLGSSTVRFLLFQFSYWTYTSRMNGGSFAWSSLFPSLY